MFFNRTHSTNLVILQNESISIFGYPYDLHYNLTDVLQLTLGPKENNDGIKSCMTYNPPEANKPGFQQRRAVSYLA